MAVAAAGFIGVITPLHLERRTARALTCAGWRVVRSGVGAERARVTARTLIAEGAQKLLLWGTAGGLDPGLEPGALVLPKRVLAEDGRDYLPDAEWRLGIAEVLGERFALVDAPLVTTSHPVATPAEKRALAARYAAVAVDMEATVVLEAAMETGTPCAVLRAVADTHTLTLPSVVMAAVGDRFLGPEIALRLLLRPGDLPAVGRLARAVRPARQALRQAARRLAAAEWK